MLKKSIGSKIFLGEEKYDPHRGLGSFSSGNGVHTESGVFCSLNRPKNTASMSAIEKAHTADPGILWRKENASMHHHA